jgi:hypothetical protein
VLKKKAFDLFLFFFGNFYLMSTEYLLYTRINMIFNTVVAIKQITTAGAAVSILSSSPNKVRINNNGVLLKKISKLVVARSFSSSSSNLNNNDTEKMQSSSMYNNHKISIEKISARVFCPKIQHSSIESTSSTTTNNDTNILKGGNPITIFKIIPQQQSSSTTTTNNNIPNNINQYLTSEQCSTLAKSCQWESVFVVPSNNNNHHNNNDVTTTTTNDLPTIQMMFYMPTGESISFCAHAAMGGAFSYLSSSNTSSNITSSSSSYSLPKVQLNILDKNNNDNNNNSNDHPTNDNTNTTATSSTTSTTTTSNYIPPTPSYVAAYDYDDNNNHHTISLDIDHIVWRQEPIDQPSILHRIIREYHNVIPSQDCTLPMIEVLPTQQEWDIHNFDQYEDEPYLLRKKMHKVIPLPTFLNSWIGETNRKKTLIFMNNESALHNTIVSHGVLSKYYPLACDSIQNTTGLYFYARKESTSSKITDVTDIQLINNNDDDDDETTPTILEDQNNSIWECVSCDPPFCFTFFIVEIFLFISVWL